MNEYQVALTKVLPYLKEDLGWPEKLISSYGRVPVQIGGNVVWADYVCYISQGDRLAPWLLVEVKQPGIPLDQALPQAESYSLLLDVPFLCITDGDSYQWYSTGKSQGRSIPLKSVPPLPMEEYLNSEYVASFPPRIDNLLDLFFIELEKKSGFFQDTANHERAVKKLKSNVFGKIYSLTPETLKKSIDEYIMLRAAHKITLKEQIDQNFARFQDDLLSMTSHNGDDVIFLSSLLDREAKPYWRGAGLFVMTQFLAGAQPDNYVILEEKVSHALRELGVIDVLVKNDTVNGYVYINDICKRLYRDKMERRLKHFDFGLPAVHNFLWHYYAHYRTHRVWNP